MIRPLQDRIVIKQQIEHKPEGSLIYIPDMVDVTQVRGEVVAVGPGRREKGKLIPCIVKVGDVVAFPKGSGSSVEIDKEKFIVMFERDILAIIS